MKVIKIVHERRMNENCEGEEDDLTMNDYRSVIKNLQKKNKTKYKFILKAGKGLDRCLFRLFKMTWECEAKPTQWENTIARHFYKGKGEQSKLSNPFPNLMNY